MNRETYNDFLEYNKEKQLEELNKLCPGLYLSQRQVIAKIINGATQAERKRTQDILMEFQGEIEEMPIKKELDRARKFGALSTIIEVKRRI